MFFTFTTSLMACMLRLAQRYMRAIEKLSAVVKETGPGFSGHCYCLIRPPCAASSRIPAKELGIALALLMRVYSDSMRGLLQSRLRKQSSPPPLLFVLATTLWFLLPCFNQQPANPVVAVSFLWSTPCISVSWDSAVTVYLSCSTAHHGFRH